MLSREDAGAERIFQNNGVQLLLKMIETGKPEMILAAVRTLSGMCTGHKARVSITLENESRQKQSENQKVHGNPESISTYTASSIYNRITAPVFMMLLAIRIMLFVWHFSHKMYISFLLS